MKYIVIEQIVKGFQGVIGTELREMRNVEVIVNCGEYLSMTSVRGGAKTKLDLNDPHREIMNMIHNRIPE